jgi:hypothetical protein
LYLPAFDHYVAGKSDRGAAVHAIADRYIETVKGFVA